MALEKDRTKPIGALEDLNKSKDITELQLKREAAHEGAQ